MTTKIMVKQGGGSASEIDYASAFTARKGSPYFERDTPLVQMGQKWADGESAQGFFTVVDPEAEVSSSGFLLRPWAEVRLTEDASGDELTLGWMRQFTADASRPEIGNGPGDEIFHNVQLIDCNADVRGLPFHNGWVREAETDWDRLQALKDEKLSGASSLQTIKRTTTDITIDSFANGHLVEHDAPVDLDAYRYKKGTDVIDVINHIAEESGKQWGIVLHHKDGATHKCLLYVDQEDLARWTSAVRISDDLADFDPDDETAPTFAPAWKQGAGREADHQQVVSGIVGIWGAGDDTTRRVLVETGEDEDDWETWWDVYNDDAAVNEATATRHATWQLNDRKRPHVSHRVSILVKASQAHLVEAGQAIQTKSVVLNSGPDKNSFVWRRVAQKIIEPAANGLYWLHLSLERPRMSHGANGGPGQPASTSPEPSPETVPNPGDTVVKFYNANDPGGDDIQWTGILGNQGGSADGANGTDWYYFKSTAPNRRQTSWAASAGTQYRIAGWVNTSSSGQLDFAFFSEAPPVSNPTGTFLLDSFIITPAQPDSGNSWVAFSAGPYTAPAGTQSAALGRTGGGVSFDEVTIYLVGDPTENDEFAFNYGDCPHDSPFFLPSDYLACRLDELNTNIADAMASHVDADVDPTVDDDIDSYRVGTIWVNTTSDTIFILVDATDGAAIWEEIGAASASARPRWLDLVMSHRWLIGCHEGGDVGNDGNSGDSWPEDTLEAFRQAAEKGADIVDLDVQRNADGSWVAMHDTSVNRTTTSTGNVNTKTDAAWAALVIDGGNGYNASRHGSANLHPPFVADCLDAIKQYQMAVYFDMKVQDTTEATALAEFVVAQDFVERTAIRCTSAAIAAAVRAVDPRITTLCSDFSGAASNPDVDLVALTATDIDTIADVRAFAPKPIVTNALKTDFGVDESTLLANMYERGVLLFLTNYLDVALAKRVELLAADNLSGTKDHGSLTGLTDDDHTQYIQKAEVTTKGDILAATASAAITRVGVGTDGQILTADSGASHGVAWSDPQATGETDGLIPVDTGTIAYDTTTPGELGITVESDWGYDGTEAYYDDTGAAAGEEASLWWDPATGQYALVTFEFP